MSEGSRQDLKKRTREFSLRVIRLYAWLPKSTVAQVLGKQVLRSATSVGAHYREATRARSDAEFISKMGGAQQELEETLYWFELLLDSGTASQTQLGDLQDEANELMAIIVTMIRNAKRRRDGGPKD